MVGHSGRRSAGGLMTWQLANVIVRDQRKTPSLVLNPTWWYRTSIPARVGQQRHGAATAVATSFRQPTQRMIM